MIDENKMQRLAEDSGMTQYVDWRNKYLERFAESVLEESSLRRIMIDKIIYVFTRYSSIPLEEMNINTSRYAPCYRKFVEMVNGPDYQQPKRYKGELAIYREDLEKLSDVQLLDFFEYVKIREYTQM